MEKNEYRNDKQPLTLRFRGKNAQTRATKKSISERRD